MAYIAVTEELRRILIEERKKSKISGENLATAIDKSRAYISQLENGKVPFIDIETLQHILRAISMVPNDDFNNYIEELLRKISIPVNLDVIEQEEWMYVFDLQVRKFAVPHKLITYISTKCNDLNITYENLVEEINKNKDLEYESTYEPNKIKMLLRNNEVGWLIRFNLDANFIKDICDGTINEINYVNALGIVYNLILLEGKLDDDANLEAERFLEEIGIITILKRNKKRNENFDKKIESGEDFELEDVEVTEDDREFRKALKYVNLYFDRLNDEKPSESHKRMKQLKNNLDTDMNLMIAIMSTPLDDFKSLPASIRKEFFDEYKDLVNKYLEKAKEFGTDIEYI